MLIMAQFTEMEVRSLIRTAHEAFAAAWPAATDQAWFAAGFAVGMALD